MKTRRSFVGNVSMAGDKTQGSRRKGMTRTNGKTGIFGTWSLLRDEPGGRLKIRRHLWELLEEICWINSFNFDLGRDFVELLEML
jgi:hypothetical protein